MRPVFTSWAALTRPNRNNKRGQSPYPTYEIYKPSCRGSSVIGLSNRTFPYRVVKEEEEEEERLDVETNVRSKLRCSFEQEEEEEEEQVRTRRCRSATRTN